MVNFRFHLVSITAVFLALGLGIVIGAGVVDRATVEFLEQRLDTVRENADRTNRENDELSRLLGQWGAFTDEAGDQLLEGRLRDTRVLVLGAQGTDRRAVDALTVSLAAAGTRHDGTLWFTGKLRLDTNADVDALAAVVGAPLERRPEVVRRAALTGMAEAWRAGSVTPVLAAMVGAGFVTYQPTEGAEVDLSLLPRSGTRFIVVSSDQPEVPNTDLAAVLVKELARAGTVPVLAAEVGHPVEGRTDTRGAFVLSLRSDTEVSGRISTVDNLEDWRGRVAAVLALEDLRAGRTGHFGIGPRAERLLPAPPP
ncbi:MAG: copper transporter [Acidimicrobiales bacterium]